MPIMRISVDFETDEDHVLADRQQHAAANDMHAFMHTVVVDGYPIPEEVIGTNTNPNYTVHMHNGNGDYCKFCLETASDGRS